MAKDLEMSFSKELGQVSIQAILQTGFVFFEVHSL